MFLLISGTLPNTLVPSATLWCPWPLRQALLALEVDAPSQDVNSSQKESILPKSLFQCLYIYTHIYISIFIYLFINFHVYIDIFFAE